MWSLGFQRACWNSWINLMSSHLTVGPHCVNRSLEVDLAPRKIDKGGDGWSSLFFLLKRQ